MSNSPLESTDGSFARHIICTRSQSIYPCPRFLPHISSFYISSPVCCLAIIRKFLGSYWSVFFELQRGSVFLVWLILWQSNHISCVQTMAQTFFYVLWAQFSFFILHSSETLYSHLRLSTTGEPKEIVLKTPRFRFFFLSPDSSLPLGYHGPILVLSKEHSALVIPWSWRNDLYIYLVGAELCKATIPCEYVNVWKKCSIKEKKYDRFLLCMVKLKLYFWEASNE
jgi:hypothetical protein